MSNNLIIVGVSQSQYLYYKVEQPSSFTPVKFTLQKQ